MVELKVKKKNIVFLILSIIIIVLVLTVTFNIRYSNRDLGKANTSKFDTLRNSINSSVEMESFVRQFLLTKNPESLIKYLRKSDTTKKLLLEDWEKYKRPLKYLETMKPKYLNKDSSEILVEVLLRYVMIAGEKIGDYRMLYFVKENGKYFLDLEASLSYNEISIKDFEKIKPNKTVLFRCYSSKCKPEEGISQYYSGVLYDVWLWDNFEDRVRAIITTNTKNKKEFIDLLNTREFVQVIVKIKYINKKEEIIGVESFVKEGPIM